MGVPIGDRNRMIRQALNDERSPLLPFELELIYRDMRHHIDEQHRLGVVMGEAMTQSSETWHDNAPAEAIADESKILSERAGRVAGLMGARALFDYISSDQEDGCVTLGSIVDIKYMGDDNPERVVLTGVSRELTPEARSVAAAESNDEVEAVTISSPLGSALLGHVPGDRVEFKGPSGRTVGLVVEAVRQLNLD